MPGPSVSQSIYRARASSRQIESLVTFVPTCDTISDCRDDTLLVSCILSLFQAQPAVQVRGEGRQRGGARPLWILRPARQAAGGQLHRGPVRGLPRGGRARAPAPVQAVREGGSVNTVQ